MATSATFVTALVELGASWRVSLRAEAAARRAADEAQLKEFSQRIGQYSDLPAYPEILAMSAYGRHAASTLLGLLAIRGKAATDEQLFALEHSLRSIAASSPESATTISQFLTQMLHQPPGQRGLVGRDFARTELAAIRVLRSLPNPPTQRFWDEHNKMLGARYAGHETGDPSELKALVNQLANGALTATE